MRISSLSGSMYVTLRRRAILIASPNAQNQNPLPGTNADIEAYFDHLTSRLGGAWKPGEILSLVDPTVAEVKTAVDDAKNADYAVVVFSGHGSHPRNSNDQTESRVRMLDGSMKVSALRPDVPKCSVIIDSCRVLTEIAPDLRQYILEHVKIAKKLASKDDYRRAFDAAVKSTARGAHYAFACSLNQTAAIHNMGSVFIRSLISQAVEWDDRVESNQSQRMRLAVIRSLHKTQTQYDQVPMLVQENPGNSFPFAIHMT